MPNVYVIEAGYAYEGSEAIGAFTTEHRATVAVVGMIDDGVYYDHVSVQRIEINTFPVRPVTVACWKVEGFDGPLKRVTVNWT